MAKSSIGSRWNGVNNDGTSCHVIKWCWDGGGWGTDPTESQSGGGAVHWELWRVLPVPGERGQVQLTTDRWNWLENWVLSVKVKQKRQSGIKIGKKCGSEGMKRGFDCSWSVIKPLGWETIHSLTKERKEKLHVNHGYKAPPSVTSK